MENPKDSTKKQLELIHEFSKVAGYKINAQKLAAFLKTNKKATDLCTFALYPVTLLDLCIISSNFLMEPFGFSI